MFLHWLWCRIAYQGCGDGLQIKDIVLVYTYCLWSVCVHAHVCVHVALDYSHVIYVDQVVSLSFYMSNQLTNIQLEQREQVIPRSSIASLYQEVLTESYFQRTSHF